MSDRETCGPWEGGANALVPQGPFGPACDVHDEDYTSNPAQLTRRQADRRFLLNMLALADSPWEYLLAWAYYAAVRVGGWKFWRGG